MAQKNSSGRSNKFPSMSTYKNSKFAAFAFAVVLFLWHAMFWDVDKSYFVSTRWTSVFAVVMAICMSIAMDHEVDGPDGSTTYLAGAGTIAYLAVALWGYWSRRRYTMSAESQTQISIWNWGSDKLAEGNPAHWSALALATLSVTLVCLGVSVFQIDGDGTTSRIKDNRSIPHPLPSEQRLHIGIGGVVVAFAAALLQAFNGVSGSISRYDWGEGKNILGIVLTIGAGFMALASMRHSDAPLAGIIRRDQTPWSTASVVLAWVGTLIVLVLFGVRWDNEDKRDNTLGRASFGLGLVALMAGVCLAIHLAEEARQDSGLPLEEEVE